MATPLQVHGRRDIATEHHALLNAVLSKDISLAQKIIAPHLQTTVDLLLREPSDNLINHEHGSTATVT